MRNIFRKFLEYYLMLTARVALTVHRTLIVAVAGSTRKTETKERLFESLSESRFKIRRNPRSYNTEIGLPISVLGIPAGGSSYFGWLVALLRAPLKIFSRYPDILILEFGTDSPGDMRRLLRIASPHIAIFTSVEPKSGDGAAEDTGVMVRELEVLLHGLPKSGAAIINTDDPLISAMAGQRKPAAEIRSYSGEGGRDAAITNAVAVTAKELAERLG